MFSPDSTASSPPQKSSQNSTLESIKQSVPVVLPVSPPPVKPLGSTSSFLPQPKSPPLSTSTPPVLGLKQKQKEPVPNPGSISSSSSEDPLNVVKPVKPANSSWERPVRAVFQIGILIRDRSRFGIKLGRDLIIENRTKIMQTHNYNLNIKI
jgi:hypothetical protein